MTIDPFRTIAYGTIIEETPEGLYRMDRLRLFEDERRAAMSPLERYFEDRINADIEAAILGKGD